MSDYKIKLAQIFGEPTTNILKNYYGGSDDLHVVNEERLLSFYDYLLEELQFPFQAKYKHMMVNCLKLDHEQYVNEENGIRIIGTADGAEFLIPLNEIKLAETSLNLPAVTVFQKWFR